MTIAFSRMKDWTTKRKQFSNVEWQHKISQTDSTIITVTIPWVFICVSSSVLRGWNEVKTKKKPYEKWSIFCLIVLKKQVVNAWNPTRPSSKWDFSSEWFYTSFSELTVAFEKVHDAYPGSKLQQFNSSQINKSYKKNMKAKDKYVAEIVYFVWQNWLKMLAMLYLIYLNILYNNSCKQWRIQSCLLLFKSTKHRWMRVWS